MRPGDLLRQLDRRLLPPLARGLVRLGQGPLRMRVLTTAALFSSVAVLVTAVWAADRAQVGGDTTVGEVTRVGVIEGESIPGYVESSRSELKALVATPPDEPGGETYALVTLAAYLAPDRLTPIIGDVSVSEVFGRVPRPQTQTELVRIPAMRIPADVVAGMRRVAERKDREAADYRARAAELPPDADQELRRLYDSGAQVALDEATAYGSGCSCVYAAIVRATPTVLDRVAARPGVRAVDAAPEVRRLDRAVFTPPLPEQRDVVRPPADDGSPTPSGGSTTAPASGTPAPDPSLDPTPPSTPPTAPVSVSPPTSEPTTAPPSAPQPPVEPSTPAPPVASTVPAVADDVLVEPTEIVEVEAR
ncbi:hypothetical protein BDK92_1447 [Micromonospora pisi]|uniref:Uncharacterized protein n=1 Tax=Micromonospora pisi TaxID=589240 RepID=A0A495JFM4_9ACTN|nr:hypothetical protein [Micromonospora pisi]RKR87174.1 hypothetical protein BDK92_1447 [Micromonospora pisi]